MSALKHWLHKFRREISWRLALVVARFPRPYRYPGRKVLVLMGDQYWNPSGKSFGDEMLLSGLLACIERSDSQATVELLDTYTINHTGGSVVFRGQELRVVRLGEWWLSTRAYFRFIGIIRDFSSFVVIGADVLDSGYSVMDSLQRLRFLRLADLVRRKTMITPCSFSGKAADVVRAGFASLGGRTKVYARDEISLGRMLTAGLSAELSADIAFLVNPTDPERSRVGLQRSIAMMLDERSRGRTILGLNLCGWHVPDRQAFLSSLHSLLNDLNRRMPIALVLIPHDTRPLKTVSDLQILQEFNELLNGDIPVVGAPDDAQSGIDAKILAGYCDLVVSGRMHLAIAAMSQTVPTLSFGYQGKFEGLYRLLGLPESMIFSYEELDKCIAAVEDVSGNVALLKQRLALNVPLAYELATKCATFEY